MHAAAMMLCAVHMLHLGHLPGTRTQGRLHLNLRSIECLLQKLRLSLQCRQLLTSEAVVDSAGHTIKDSVSNLAHNVPEPLSHVLDPITAALHPTTVAQAPAPAGADTEVHVDEVDPVRTSRSNAL